MPRIASLRILPLIALITVCLSVIASPVNSFAPPQKSPPSAPPPSAPPPPPEYPQPGAPHWAQSPYLPNCEKGPCRQIIIADKTFDPVYNYQIERWVNGMNSIRSYYKVWNLPKYIYYGPRHGIQPDPSCGEAQGAISVCVNGPIINRECVTPNGGAAGCAQPRLAGNHIYQARVLLNPSTLRDGPIFKWNLACHEIGHAIGLPHNDTAPKSCVANVMTTEYELFYNYADWVTLNYLYNTHPVENVFSR